MLTDLKRMAGDALRIQYCRCDGIDDRKRRAGGQWTLAAGLGRSLVAQSPIRKRTNDSRSSLAGSVPPLRSPVQAPDRQLHKYSLSVVAADQTSRGICLLTSMYRVLTDTEIHVLALA